MTRKFQCKTIPSSWLEQNGRRLDCGPYLSGAIEARQLLKKHQTSRLQDLTAGHQGGIYNGPQFIRNYVEDPENGVPFLTTTSMLQSDTATLPMISRKDAHSSKLRHLKLEPGMILITCSGSIGRMSYCRQDMAEMWSNQDIMKVVADRTKILPGYLYAFLSSRFGVPLVVSGTYGAIIQHIEPQHISNLPVPRLHNVEDKAHELIQQAADLRTAACFLLKIATERLIETLALPVLPSKSVSDFGWSLVSSSNLRNRLDATFHSSAALVAEAAVRNGRVPPQKLSKVTQRMFKPPIFKRIWVDQPQYGRQFVSGIDAYLYEANDLRYVSYRTPQFDEFIVKPGWVIFQAAGQIYGLFGRPLFVSGWLNDVFCADDLYRIVPHNEVDGAYIYLFLRTPHGEVLIKRQASGNSIPRVWDPHMADVEIPWPSAEIRKQFATPVIEAHEKIAEALELQREAVKLVEQTIEKEGSR